MQRKRNQQRQLKRLENRADEKVIAKMDVLEANNHAVLREYWLIPVIAKMDVLRGISLMQRKNGATFSDCKDGRDRFSNSFSDKLFFI